jgi:hypothetical protein
MFKPKTSVLLATAAAAVTSFGSAAVAQASIVSPRQHPENIGGLKHPDAQVKKHPEGRLAPRLLCRACNLNGSGSHV